MGCGVSKSHFHKVISPKKASDCSARNAVHNQTDHSESTALINNLQNTIDQSVFTVSNDPLSVSAQASPNETTTNHLSPRINSTTSNNHSVLADSNGRYQQQIDSATSNRNTLSFFNENNQSDITNMLEIETLINVLPAVDSDYVEIINADPEGFNDLFLKQRQDAIDNSSYRRTIESWHPESLHQLVEFIRDISKDKLLLDRHWMIFYWIACNIEYDAVSFLNNNIQDQSAESVFRTRKGVCAGFSRLYKSLCDQLALKCEEISGYAKGYGFAVREETAFLKTDHAWNVVEIGRYWYPLDATWGTGHLNEQDIFNRELDTFYFLTRPDQLIYSHLPENDKWQLLRQPIKMTQYTQMPTVHPAYFIFNLEIVSPRHQAHATLVHGKSHALILIRAPSDIDVSTTFELYENEVDGGSRIIFDKSKQLYCCYFSPASIGRHKIDIFAKRIELDMKSGKQALSFTLNIVELPLNRVSYPTTSKEFYDLNIKIISPLNTHLIKVCDGATYGSIIIRAPSDVELSGGLDNSSGERVMNGCQVYYDQRKSLWKCKFAPNRNGLYKAYIFGKKKANTGNYSHLVSFKTEASQIPATPLSFPKTWQVFHDLNLEIEVPKNCSTVIWPTDASYVESFIQTPDDVQLSCAIHYNDVVVENGALAEFDSDKRLWQLLFAPQCIGQHELIVFANRYSESNSKCALKFDLNITQLKQPIKFPTIYPSFQVIKGRIYEPINGLVKKDTTISIHCFIPGAKDVNLTIDSKWANGGGYEDPFYKRTVTVGSKEVTIYAKYGEDFSYQALIKYNVQ
ncbi:unnamed protein product [Adineta steineri]|uniref:Transglutaminase-like domain-containing protein n=1 Tax=Adineta steineri TaxID=433720 RepID=A0A815V2U0_9BILA|nr:unnamed protein product [Adineta steineri]CAF1523939.1 unnamed protein product [Adineta steineri]